MTVYRKYKDSPWMKQEQSDKYKLFMRTYAYEVSKGLISIKWISNNLITNFLFNGRRVCYSDDKLCVVTSGKYSKVLTY